MRIISVKRLRDFWQSGYADAKQPLKCWYQIFKKEVFEDSTAIKQLFPSASILGNGRVVSNISGNKYRLIVQIRYDLRIVFIRFVGTHAEYNKISAKKV